MMVLGLLAIVMTGLFILMAHSLFALSHAEQHQQAVSAGRYLIESMKERDVSFQIGVFDGRIPTDTIDGFPPPPYPSVVHGREYWFVVETTEVSDRLLGMVVKVVDEDRVVTQIETVLKK
jgi:hypothetical protein